MLLAAIDRAETAFRLGVGAILALGAWLLLLGLLATVTRARRPDPGPESMELGGDEPPAVVNMLANGWALGREAVPATLLASPPASSWPSSRRASTASSSAPQGHHLPELGAG